MIKKRLPQSCLLFVCLVCSSALHAQHHYLVPLGSLGYSEESIDELSVPINRVARTPLQAVRFPDIQFDDARVEAYIAIPEQEEDNRNPWGSEAQSQLNVALRLPSHAPFPGQVKMVHRGLASNVVYDFNFDPGSFEEVSREEFERARQLHYARLANSPIPGGHWFRYQAGDEYQADSRARPGNNLGDFDSSFNMFSGQRAVSENLALDRSLILGSSETSETVDVSSITGVTVNAIDWAQRLTDAPTSIDPLAMVIPHDQHAVFFSSIKDLNTTIRAVEQEGLSFISTQSNRKVYQGLADKYQQQMGIQFPDLLAEQLPVKSVAITGGDPFLPSGSDVGVVFETDSPEALRKALQLVIEAQAESHGVDLSAQSSGDDSTDYGYSNSDRSFSSFLFAGDGYVAVTNSQKQLDRLKRVASGETTALGATEEYKFFRQRYPLGDSATAFVFLSDATLRRWASPAFRIAASRRVRAAAALGQATAQTMAGDELEQTYADLVGPLTQTGQTIHSAVFNTLDFLTPIAELDLKTVTAAEKEAYERWRRGYESGWARFDPIALRLIMDETAAGLDLSVIPLRIGTRYNQWMRIAGDATLDAVATTPHPEAMMMVSYAIDSDSQMFQMASNRSSAMLPGVGANPLAWVDGSFSIYLDDDPFWEAMTASEDPKNYIKANLARLPVGVRINSNSPVKLALFLTTLRGFSEQAAPGLLQWETREHEETPYVVIEASENAELSGELDFRIQYAALPDALLLSLNEDVLKRAITRNLNRTDDSTPKSREPVQAFAHARLNTLQNYLNLMEGEQLPRQQAISWAALPILNEWRRRFPKQDPVAVHASYFGEQIQCPGGKGYQWNAEIGSMESVVFGSPEAPRGELVQIPLLQNWHKAKAAIGLTNNELRVKAELTRN